MNRKIIDAHSHLWLRQDTVVDGMPIRTLTNGRSLFMGEIRQMVQTEFVVVDTHDYMYELIGRLPRKERCILELALQGYDTKEIAEQIGMEYNTVRHYKKEAYAKIREALKNEI